MRSGRSLAQWARLRLALEAGGAPAWLAAARCVGAGLQARGSAGRRALAAGVRLARWEASR